METPAEVLALQQEYRDEILHVDAWFTQGDLPYAGTYFPGFTGMKFNDFNPAQQGFLLQFQPIFADVIWNIFAWVKGAINYPGYKQGDRQMVLLDFETDEPILDGQGELQHEPFNTHLSRKLTYQSDLMNTTLTPVSAMPPIPDEPPRIDADKVQAAREILEDRPPNECPTCGFVAKNQRGLAVHMRKHKETG